MQRDGYVAALRDPDVLAAIQGGPHGRIALGYVEWAGPGRQTLAVPWRLIDDAASAQAFTRELDLLPVAPVRGTSISAGLGFVAGLFALNGFAGMRLVVDVSGDGPNNSGAPVEPARQALLAAGVVINGLPILLKGKDAHLGGVADLERYYEDCVIGGPGSFVVPVHAPEQFAEAIRRKMVLEIAARPPPARVVPAGFGVQAETDCLAGQKGRRIGSFELPRPGPPA